MDVLSSMAHNPNLNRMVDPLVKIAKDKAGEDGSVFSINMADFDETKGRITLNSGKYVSLEKIGNHDLINLTQIFHEGNYGFISKDGTITLPAHLKHLEDKIKQKNFRVVLHSNSDTTQKTKNTFDQANPNSTEAIQIRQVRVMDATETAEIHTLASRILWQMQQSNTEEPAPLEAHTWSVRSSRTHTTSERAEKIKDESGKSPSFQLSPAAQEKETEAAHAAEAKAAERFRTMVRAETKVKDFMIGKYDLIAEKRATDLGLVGGHPSVKTTVDSGV